MEEDERWRRIEKKRMVKESCRGCKRMKEAKREWRRMLEDKRSWKEANKRGWRMEEEN